MDFRNAHNVLLVGASIGGSNVHLAIQIVGLLVLLRLLVMVVMMMRPATYRRAAVLVRAVLGDVVKGGGRSRAA